MTDDFQQGLITGLALQPLQVTTEHATPDPVEAKAFICATRKFDAVISIFRTTGEPT